jgi:hypothetical protein
MTTLAVQDRVTSGFQISVVVCIVAIIGLLSVFVSPLWILAPLLGIALLWLVFNYSISALGIVLAFMPFDFLAIGLGKYLGLPHMTFVSVCDKEGVLILLALLLWRKNGFKLASPDWFLLACFILAVIRTAFGGTLLGLLADFAFIVSYFTGRVAVLTPEQEHLWAKCAVWIVGILSVVGLTEVFIFGEGPRTLLYTVIGSETDAGQLTASFHGAGFSGLREAATMVGPNAFGVLCMIALIIWWVYSRNPLPASMVAVGLITSVTRSAWLGIAGAIPVLAVIMQQKRRFAIYTTLALALFVASIPVLGLSDYIFYNKTGQDTSAQSHERDILDGLKYSAEHPFGSGNGSLSPLALEQDSNANIFETTYPDFAAEYGIAAALCFVGFIFSAGRLLWRSQSQLNHAALGILVGISLVMVVALPLIDRRLSTWALFPIGLAVRSSVTQREASVPELRGTLRQETA